MFVWVLSSVYVGVSEAFDTDKFVEEDMRAIVVVPGEENSIHIKETDIPKISETEALVKVKLVGLDRTDREIIKGLHGEPPEGKKELILGHESLGRIVKVGSQVKSLEPGNFVVATVRRPDDCINCRAEEYDMCLKGNYTERGIKGMDGFLSDYYIEDERFLVRVPAELGELAIMLEPTSVAEKAVRTAFEVQRRMKWRPETAMITGTGTLGLITAVLLKLKGLDVVSVDRSNGEYKKKIFSKLGVRHFNDQKINLHDIPKKIGKRIDIIFEMTGSSSVALHVIMIAGTNAAVVLSSITGGDKHIVICSDCFNQGMVLGNKTVVGTVSSNKRDFQQGIVDLLAAEKRWPGLLAKFITGRYSPERISEAISSMGENIKTVIEFDTSDLGNINPESSEEASKESAQGR